MIPFESLEPFARAAATALGLDLLEAVALAAIVCAVAAVSRSSATTRHVLWWIALAACAALPVASIASSFGHVERRVAAGAPATAAHARAERPGRHLGARTAASVPVEIPVSEALPVTALAGEPAGAVAAAPALFVGGWNAATTVAGLPYAATALIALWLAVAGVGWTRLALSLFALHRIKRDALPLDDSVVRRLRRWRHSARTGRAVTLAVSNDVDVPVAVGFRSPAILLPASVVEHQEIADIDQIAMHEYAHLERYDDWTNLLQRVFECALWFNPIVTAFIGRRISLEREVACDDWVIAQTGRAHRYATCLWKLVESSRLPATPIVAPGVLLSPREITVRIERLLDSRRNALPRLSPLGSLGVGALALAGAVFAAQHAPAVALTDVPCPPAVSPAAATHATAPRPALAADRDAALEVEKLGEIGGIKLPAPPALPAAAAPNAAPAAAPAAGGRLPAQPAAGPQPAPAPAARPRAVALAPLDEDEARAEARTAARDAARDATRDGARAAARATARDATQISAEAQRAARAALDAGAESAAMSAASATVSGVVADAVKRAVATSARAVALDDLGDAPEHLDRASLQKCGACDLHGQDLRGLDLHGISLAGADLRGADLRGANLAGAKLEGSDLGGARFDDANLSGATLEGSDVRGASFVGANLEGLRLEGTSVRGAIFRGSQLRSVVDRCAGCDLRGFDLHGQDLHGIRLDGTDLRGADLRNADLSGAHLTGVDLRDAKLDGASLRNAVLRGCSLRGADRSHADTTGASIDESND
jgi:uncharacterized protein YjbI with pentapeptide repeats/beta-lactamase regulating signal transducer with metallopeptidase domain